MVIKMKLYEAFALLTVCAHPLRYEIMAFIHDTGEVTFDEVNEYISEFYPDLFMARSELDFIFSELEHYKILSERGEVWGTLYFLTNRGVVLLEVLSDLDERKELL